MSNVVQFQTSEEQNARRVQDEMWALVEREDVLTGINASLHTLAALIAAHSSMHPEAVGLADRCADLLKTMVSDLKEELA